MFVCGVLIGFLKTSSVAETVGSAVPREAVEENPALVAELTRLVAAVGVAEVALKQKD